MTETEVMNMPVDKFMWYVDQAGTREAREMESTIHNLVVSIGGMFSKKGSDHLKKFVKELRESING